MKFSGKTAVVTGGAQGIGRAVAERFAEEGAQVFVLDVAAPAPSSPLNGITVLRCDVGDEHMVDESLDQICSMAGGIDVVVNDAAILSPAPFLDTRLEDFDAVLRVNLRGTFVVSLAAAKRMVARGKGGSIINMSSINAVVASEDQTAYAASKGGVHMLTRSMAVQLASHHIRVNAVGPGTVGTEMALKHIDDVLLDRIPMNRVATVDEISNVVLFLASSEASYITGQTIYVDGGRLALNIRKRKKILKMSLEQGR